MTKPVLVNTLSWQRCEVVAIPDELWKRSTVEEKYSKNKQSGKDGKTLGKIKVDILDLDECSTINVSAFFQSWFQFRA